MGHRFKYAITLLSKEFPFLFVIVLFSLNFLGISSAIELSLLAFIIISSFRIIEVVPLIGALSHEQREVASELGEKIKGIIKFYGIFAGFLTGIVISVWQLGLGEAAVVPLSAAWLIFVVILTQMLVWYTSMSDVVGKGSKILHYSLFYPISFVLAGGTAWIASTTGVPALLDFAIVFGGFGISNCILYNYIGHLWLRPDWFIKSGREIDERRNKLNDMKRSFPNLFYNIQTQIKKARETDIIVSENSSKYFIVLRGENPKFYDMENKIEITEQVTIEKLNIADRLKNNLHTILSQSVKKEIFHGRLAYSLFKTRLAPNYKVAIEHYMSNPENEILRYYATLFLEIHQDFSLKLSKIKKMLLLFSEVPSIELAEEICEETKNVQENSDKILNVFKEGSAIWEKYFGKWSRIFLINPEDARKDVEKVFKWLSKISNACRTILCETGRNK